LTGASGSNKLLVMEIYSDNKAVIDVLKRLMPEIRREAASNGLREEAVLESALRRVLQRARVVDVARMAREADASGYDEIEDFDGWQAGMEGELKASFS
jgi:hypothetical protein